MPLQGKNSDERKNGKEEIDRDRGFTKQTQSYPVVNNLKQSGEYAENKKRIGRGSL